MVSARHIFISYRSNTRAPWSYAIFPNFHFWSPFLIRVPKLRALVSIDTKFIHFSVQLNYHCRIAHCNYFQNFADCFEKRSVKKNYISKPYSYSVADAKECQLQCQKREECSHFQFNLNAHNMKNCYLKTSRAGEVTKPNNCCIFGPKNCNGNIYISMCICTSIFRRIINRQ